jgi:hypothetical protein
MTSDWSHELRNAINTAATSAAVVGMLLEKGDAARAYEFNLEVLNACERCRQLMEIAPSPDC